MFLRMVPTIAEPLCSYELTCSIPVRERRCTISMDTFHNQVCSGLSRPDYALFVSNGTARLHLTEEGTIDNTAFLGPGTEYSSTTFDITWTPTGKVHLFRPGSSDPTDPSNFAAEIRFATATGSFAVVQNGVTYTINSASSPGVFAEMGTERNGSFLP